MDTPLNAFAENPVGAAFASPGSYGAATPLVTPPVSGTSVRQRGSATVGMDAAAPGNIPGEGRYTPPRSRLDPVNPKVNPHASGVKEFMKATWQQEFTLVWLTSCAVFVVTMLLWAYNFLARPAFCIICSSLAVIYCLAVLRLKQEKKQLYHPLAVLVIFCIAAGSLAGLYIYDTCTIFPAFYGNTRTYYNVVPNQPANSVADAGKLTFASEAFVDVTQAAGIVTEDGSSYCAAPIRDGTGINRLQFWAVGTGCCSGVGTFTCDESGNAQAKAGIIVFDNNNYFGPSRFTNYEKAREKAQATFGLQSVSAVAYVRWVMEGDLDMLASEYRIRGWSLIATFTVLGAVLLYVCTAFVYVPPPASGAFQAMA